MDCNIPTLGRPGLVGHMDIIVTWILGNSDDECTNIILDIEYHVSLLRHHLIFVVMAKSHLSFTMF